ncbi:MAG: ion channel [Deltaproteobacteria bacterium]|jgi:inward rectifier potassium channel
MARTPKSRSQRYLDNRGQPTIEVRGLPSAPLRDLFHQLLTMRWGVFLALAFVTYVALNGVFAVFYYFDSGGVDNVRPGSFSDAYFFSVESMMTIGYGRMVPVSTLSHVLVTIESFVGLLTTALLTGLIFAKFATPTANVLFSDVVCIARHDGHPTVLFRLANARGNRLIQASLSVTLAKTIQTKEGETFRRVHDVALVRSTNPLFWIGWTVMHRIDASSPFHGETKESLIEKGAEMIVVLSGVDEHSSSTVHTRRSYSPEEMRWGERFVDLLMVNAQSGLREVDYARFHETQPAEL